LQVHDDSHGIHQQRGYGDQEHETVAFMVHCRNTRVVEFAGSQQLLFQGTGNR